MGPGAKNISVNHGGNYSRGRALAFRIVGDRLIAAGNDAGPADQVVSFANPLQYLAKLSISRASIGNVSSIIQIQDQRTFEKSRGHPFKKRRTKEHRLTLHKHGVHLTKQR